MRLCSFCLWNVEPNVFQEQYSLQKLLLTVNRTGSAAVQPWARSRKQQLLLWGQNFFAVWGNTLGQFSRSLKQKLCSRESIQTVQLTWLHCLLNLSLILRGFLHSCLQAWFTSAGSCPSWRKEGCPGRFVLYFTLGFVFLLFREEEKYSVLFCTSKPNTLL